MISSEKIQKIRAQFPITSEYSYFNNASVCPTSTKVKEAVSEYLDDLIYHGVLNESGWEKRAEKVREQFANLVGASPKEVTFVRNTSHGLSLFASGFPWKKGDNVLVATSEEYPSNVYPWQQLALQGVEIREVLVAFDRHLPLESFSRAINGKTKAIAVSSVNYTTGFRVDLAGLGELARSNGAYLIVDGIQSLGALQINVKDLGIHLLSADSHKWLLGFPGIGGCYISEDLIPKLTPPLVGWKSTKGAWDFDQARYELWESAEKFEEGSPNYASIYGLGATLDILEEMGIETIEKQIFSLTDLLIDGLKKLNFPILSSLAPKERSGIISFQIPKKNPHEIMKILDQEKFSISFRRKSFRVSPHFYNTPEEILNFLECLKRWR